MKKKIVQLLIFIISKLERLKSNYVIKKSSSFSYSSLSPIDVGDNEKHYYNALKWALNNRKEKDIKNIALTGSYGSGKSTILKTFQRNYKEKDLTFLNISLATFKDEKAKKDENGKLKEKDKNELLRLIETSILQQIFYHEEDKKIPDSRFKKIKSYSTKNLILLSGGLFLFLISILHHYNSTTITKAFINFSINDTIKNILHYTSLLLILLGCIFFIYKSIRIISSLTIDKINFKNVEIGIGENKNKSILNHHLDEILYFFSVRPHNVVVIEDLDRFEETEIFTKLREINLLLNNSEKTKNKNIVFIYAVRDEMFKGNERIKFFDFIIPVIPIINSSNSIDKLYKKNKDNNYNLSDEFIESIAFYIDDMRLLHNICNEFSIYKAKHKQTPLIDDKLFAIITYKNIYPKDFVKLNNNKGFLFKIINSKNKYIQEEISKVNNEILLIKEKIKNIESVLFKNVKDLRAIYISKVLSKLIDFRSFVINSETITFNQLLENFEYLKNDNLFYNMSYLNRNYGRIDEKKQKISINFSELENEVDSNKSYDDREKEINDYITNKVNSIKLEIKKLEKNKNEIRGYMISDLLKSNFDINFELYKKINKNLIKTILRGGYISEDYLDYISLFHEESITQIDHKFIINIRHRQNSDFSTKLTKLKKIIPKINLLDFNSEYVLNYDLMNYLLTNASSYEKQLDYLFTKLKDETQESLSFIREYINHSIKYALFINYLCKYWSNIWSFTDEDPSYTNEDKEEIIKNIIRYADIKSIEEIAKNSTLISNIYEIHNFLNIIPNKNKIQRTITALNLKFNSIDFKNAPEDLIDFIYNDNFYELNTIMVSSIIKKYGELDQINLDNSNYKAVKQSKAIKLIEYVDNNLDEYINKIYLKIKSNINEDELYLLELLNSKNLKTENKNKIIEKTNTKIAKIDDAIYSAIQFSLIDHNKVNAKWSNLFSVYIESSNKISNSIIRFINNIENAKSLSKFKIPNKKLDDGNTKYGGFTRDLFETNEINNDSYDLISKCSPWWYSNLKIQDHDTEKVISLIDNVVINPTLESFTFLKENFNGLNIRLIEKRKTSSLKIIDKFTLDEDDLELVLKSKILNISEKNKYYKTCSEAVVFSKTDNLNLISEIIINDSSFEVSDTHLKQILLTTEVKKINRIKLFNKKSITIDTIFIDKFLINLKGSFAEIVNKGRKAKVEDTTDNKAFLEKLEAFNYISSYSMRKGFLIVNHKRKQNKES